MKSFSDLFRALDETNKTGEKLSALARYFASAEAESAAWALFFLTGRRLKRVIKTGLLSQWALEEAGIAAWLFQECYGAVGDLSETIALLLPASQASNDEPLATWCERLIELQGAEPSTQRRIVLDSWRALDADQRLVWNKMLLGNFRLGVSQQLVLRGLSQATGIEVSRLTERLMGPWSPTAESYLALIGEQGERVESTQPYPFCLAYPIEQPELQLGTFGDWLFEWKWDGIRSQLVKRGGQVALWSRGEELVTERFPELDPLGARLADGCVIDAEVLAWIGDRPLPFSALQKRITRKHLTRSLLKTIPVCLVAYDLLEHEHADIRTLPLAERRGRLEQVANAVSLPGLLRLSPRVEAASWQALAEARAQSRAHGAEGLMIKRLDSPYHVGRTKGDWWKWKIDPLTVDCVLTAAQRGNGKRASLYTDYTFSIWDRGRLVSFAKAYSGLTDEEIGEVDAFVRTHMKEKFGPVRTVDPALVFELGFESIQRSTRHKSGVAVRFPRILRWRRDKRPEDADTLETISALIEQEQIVSSQGKTGSTMREGLLFDL